MALEILRQTPAVGCMYVLLSILSKRNCAPAPPAASACQGPPWHDITAIATTCPKFMKQYNFGFRCAGSACSAALHSPAQFGSVSLRRDPHFLIHAVSSSVIGWGNEVCRDMA